MSGSVMAVFLVVFREALEASLIVGIILTALAKLNQQRYFAHVFWSVAASIAVSILAGVGLMGLTGSIKGQMEKMIEGLVSLAACGVLTYMVFWMEEQSRKLKSDIETKVEIAATRGEIFTIILLPFFAVFREGAETVLYLAAINSQSGGAVSFWGCVGGLALAVAIVYAIFYEGRRIPLKPLFKWTGYFLLFMAAGLLAYGVHELEELGWIHPIRSHIWDINWLINEKQGVGSFLKALFGYNGNPSLTEVIVYVAYLTGISLLLRRAAVKVPTGR